MGRPQILCLTPVKNEDWILDRFLRCSSLWADRIIILDDRSSDDSREIANSFSKVRLITNESDKGGNIPRFSALLHAAREEGDRNILIRIDADEVISANVLSSPAWQRIYTLQRGTRIFSDL